MLEINFQYHVQSYLYSIVLEAFLQTHHVYSTLKRRGNDRFYLHCAQNCVRYNIKSRVLSIK